MTRSEPLDPNRANGVALLDRGGDVTGRPAARAAHRPLPADGTHVLARALGDYVRAVAEAVGVPREGTTCEVTDTATAYLALGCRAVDHPDRDVMLVWSASRGWVVSIETSPGEAPIVLSRSTGDLVPTPGAVARFVAESVTGRGSGRRPVVLPPYADWSDLAERMELRASAS